MSRTNAAFQKGRFVRGDRRSVGSTFVVRGTHGERSSFSHRCRRRLQPSTRFSPLKRVGSRRLRAMGDRDTSPAESALADVSAHPIRLTQHGPVDGVGHTIGDPMWIRHAHDRSGSLSMHIALRLHHAYILHPINFLVIVADPEVGDSIAVRITQGERFEPIAIPVSACRDSRALRIRCCVSHTASRKCERVSSSIRRRTAIGHAGIVHASEPNHVAWSRFSMSGHATACFGQHVREVLAGNVSPCLLIRRASDIELVPSRERRRS